MQTIRTSGPQGSPTIPPVTGLIDCLGTPINLDQDAILVRLRGITRLGLSPYRVRIVTIGDPGLPGKEVVGVRPHGSTYREVAGPGDLEVHTFDELAWLNAETAAATEMGERVDLSLCLFGGFYFERFQQATAAHYLKLTQAVT